MSDEKAVPVDPETAAEAAEGADVDDEKKLQTREAAEQDSALGKLTDRVEERELDQSKVKRAMAGFSKTQQEEREAERLRNRELAAVKVQKEDVDLIALEFEVDKKLAERRLREHGGNVKSTLISFL